MYPNSLNIKHKTSKFKWERFFILIIKRIQYNSTSDYGDFLVCYILSLFQILSRFFSISNFWKPEAVARRCFLKREFLEVLQNSLENTRARVSFLIKLKADACNFIKKEALTQVFYCRFFKMSKNTFSYRTPLVAASGKHSKLKIKDIFNKKIIIENKFDLMNLFQRHECQTEMKSLFKH